MLVHAGGPLNTTRFPRRRHTWESFCAFARAMTGALRRRRRGSPNGERCRHGRRRAVVAGHGRACGCSWANIGLLTGWSTGPLHAGRTALGMRALRLDTVDAHGAGHTMSSAVAARPALGNDLPRTVQHAVAHGRSTTAAGARAARRYGWPAPESRLRVAAHGCAACATSRRQENT